VDHDYSERPQAPVRAGLRRLTFSARFVYTALDVAVGVLVVFLAGAGWNAVRRLRRLVRRRR